MVQVCTAISEDLSLIPSTQVRLLPTAYSSSSSGFSASGLCEYLHSHEQTPNTVIHNPSDSTTPSALTVRKKAEEGKSLKSSWTR